MIIVNRPRIDVVLFTFILFEDELDQFMILAKNENITNPIDIAYMYINFATWPAIDISKGGNNFT